MLLGEATSVLLLREPRLCGVPTIGSSADGKSMSSEDDRTAGDRTSPGAPSPGLPPAAWYLHPYLHLALNCILMTASELLLKVGARETAQIVVPEWLSWTGFMTLGSGWV